VKNGKMILNEYGQIANDEWIKLSERFSNFELDVFQIMPNHMHGIILLNDASVGAGFTPAPNYVNSQNDGPSNNYVKFNDEKRATARVAPTVSDIVGVYKSLVANGCLNIYKSKNESMGKLWQRNYYEHIIRTERSLSRISEYIVNNPHKWIEDKFFIK
jgi:putative transposase